MTISEQMHGDLITATSRMADAALAPISAAMMRQLSGMLDHAQQQLSAMQEAIPKDNVVMHPRR
ncbi:hypothetical protein [Sulfitobacter sp. M13]